MASEFGGEFGLLVSKLQRGSKGKRSFSYSESEGSVSAEGRIEAADHHQVRALALAFRSSDVGCRAGMHVTFACGLDQRIAGKFRDFLSVA